MDFAATFVFAISDARRQAASRDPLIGAIPPAAVADWRYPAAAVAAGLPGFFASDMIRCRRAAFRARCRDRTGQRRADFLGLWLVLPTLPVPRLALGFVCS